MAIFFPDSSLPVRSGGLAQILTQPGYARFSHLDSRKNLNHFNGSTNFINYLALNGENKIHVLHIFNIHIYI